LPTYEYECKQCGHRFEAFQSMKDAPLADCPQCGGALRRLPGTGAGILFKGSGFYSTDYRSPSYREKAKAESGKPEGGKAEGGKPEGGKAEGGKAEGGKPEGTGRAAKPEAGQTPKRSRADSGGQT
jgi:putative FmdB family regulatory protein